MKEQVQNKFKELFNRDGKLIFSPGRVNLIGEHIDYNGGNVFPFSINLGIWGCYAKNNLKKIRVLSKDFCTEVYEFGVYELYKIENHWANYIKGVLYVFNNKGYIVNEGFDLVISSTLPPKSGLSSSAAFELLVENILCDLFHFNISKIELALLGKEVENSFIGVNSGIMDQFIVSVGKENTACLLNTSSLEYKLIPFNLLNKQIVVINSNVSRTLDGSAYNKRVSECKEGLEYYKKYYKGINNLCELSISQIEKYKEGLDNIIYKRVKHCVTEQARVLEMVKALSNNDYNTVDLLLHDSHISLKNDYEVSCKELDVIVETANNLGILGIRMTGAGFGGCTVGIIDASKVDLFVSTLSIEYKQKTGLTPSFYIVSSSNGTHIL
ncbi:MAG: galactokinase [Acholeplasmatales bacterium]|jgi:galactokinase|nr:galactokinase [Acholeplasmatales bacterium]